MFLPYFLPHCLLANVISKFQMNPGHPYVRLMSKSKITQREMLLS